MLASLKKRRDILYENVKDVPGFKCFKPDCAFYIFVNVTEAAKKLGFSKVEEFRKYILQKTGVCFCTRDHFGTPFSDENQMYIRLAFSGINEDLMIEACNKLKELLKSGQKPNF